MNRSNALTLFGVVAVLLLGATRAAAQEAPAPSPPAPHIEVTIACSDHAICSPDLHIETAPAPAPDTPVATPELSPPAPPTFRDRGDAAGGSSLMAGGFYTTFPKQVLSVSTAYFPGASSGRLAVDAAHAEGAVLSLGGDAEDYSVRLDLGFGTGSYSGTMAAGSNSVAVDGDLDTATIALRFGARLPFRYIAFAAGTGLGGSLAFLSDSRARAVIDSPSAAWNVPFWASIDLKPACDWGIEIGASYNAQPLNLDESTATVQAGLLWQPTPSCSQERSPTAS